jgi:hypothetical protein
MKRIGSILLLAFGVSGCTGPRYQVSVTSVPSSAGLSDWVAIRVDRQTGASWYSYNQAINKTSLKPEWRPISSGTDTRRP